MDYLSHKYFGWNTKLVINYEVPAVEKYIPRVARYDSKVAENLVVVTLVLQQELKSLENYSKINVSMEESKLDNVLSLLQ